MSKDKPGRIEITAQDVKGLIERGEKRSFTAQDYAIVVALLRNYFALHDAYQEKSRTILRFLSRIFGCRTVGIAGGPEKCKYARRDVIRF